MNVLTSALGAGFSQEQILQHILKKFPQYASKVSQAIASGYTADQILRYVIGGRKAVTESNVQPSQTEHERTRGAEKKQKEDIYKASVAIPATALGAYGLLGKGTQASAQAIRPSAILPAQQQIGNRQPQIGMQPQRGLPHVGPKAPVNPPQQPPHAGATPIPTAPKPPVAPQTPAAPTPPQAPASQILGNFPNVKDRVDTLLAAGNSPDVISGTVQKLLRPEEKNALKQVQEPLESIIGRYVQESQQAPQEKPPAQEVQAQPQVTPEQPITPEKEIVKPEIQGVLEKPKEIKAKETVILPSGEVGEVKATNNKNAIVKVDGKDRQVKSSDLESLPIPEKDLADLLQDLITGIEKDTGEEISRMANIVGYDANHNELVFKPYLGATYTYTDISPEDVKLLTSILNVRKTSGGNYIGAWAKDSKSPIGSALSALIRKLQSERGGKGSEYSRKFETVYQADEPAHLALKEKKKKQADEERRKKKIKK